MKFNILSFHSFSIYENGGGSRILRRMYEGNEHRITSLIINTYTRSLSKGIINEIIINAPPTVSTWMRWVIRSGAVWAQKNLFYKNTVKRIQQIASNLSYEVVHVIDHGPYSAALCKMIEQNNKQLWVSFHDHFNFSGGSYESTNKLWTQANRRLVISQELGSEYQRLFANLEYEILTDGVTLRELSKPKGLIKKSLIIYFAGLLHIDYLPLFTVLVKSLNIMVNNGYDITLILRGTQLIKFSEDIHFRIMYKPFSLNNSELKSEMDSADILYLPMKFSDKNFYMFSLSTKMVGYLGASGVTLYHGPEDSAVSRLLQRSDSALFSFDLDEEKLYQTLLEAFRIGLVKSQNAKILAQEKFSINLLRQKFWDYYK